MLKKQRLTAMEGKHHDALPRYSRKGHEKLIAELEAAHREAMQAGDREGAKMIGAEIAKHALQQHHNI